MKLCRFDGGKLGVVGDQGVLDVSRFLESLPRLAWCFPLANPVVSRLGELSRYVAKHRDTAPRYGFDQVRIETPIPRPSKIIGAPVNYHAHLEEARADRALHQELTVHPIDEIGLFLKATSALVGPGASIPLCQPERRSDHEAEVAVIIGREAAAVPAQSALDYVAGYTLALDLSVRGREDRSMRKSPDGYAVVGPYLVTPDEIDDVDAIAFELAVNGELRQSGSTALLIRTVPELIEMASRFYTLHPGDIIMTGTPAGVAPLRTGDHLRLASAELGVLEVDISAARPSP